MYSYPVIFLLSTSHRSWCALSFRAAVFCRLNPSTVLHLVLFAFLKLSHNIIILLFFSHLSVIPRLKINLCRSEILSLSSFKTSEQVTQVCEIKNKAYLFLVADQHPLLFLWILLWSKLLCSSCVYIWQRKKNVGFTLHKFCKMNILNKPFQCWGFDRLLHQDIISLLF